ncbi:tRNA (adenosine(37)-N6)-dimethylallyltransferase MiaA [Bhargavaea beijingensis]|uniref:tRNA (adenosine(37)-N6)-dimethylallyltransferase MiaA n=1 Tax=Bhargavaea beijingensis TaxID=426756 RepID=UPI00222432CF|nr:tRNA (adenosine(37)-N6)-dimethylallyltransferase MiaA [Bhargavaea beijingensis]MCW1928257.1 tRNA (adenosine(37)-N6)-dimethylallyltransferase MiaA [Bhargavaea beijingensis]
MSGNGPEVVAIVGPTASGKTDLSVSLAEATGGEVINGDAFQVYRGLDIGTAKIAPDEMRGVPHHLFDILGPGDEFSVADYQRLVREKIAEIRSRGRLPIITGGTGLYVQSVLYDYRFTEQKEDPELRRSLERMLREKGPENLHDMLKKRDPVSAAEIHPNNTRRVMRALEIAALTGKTKKETEGKDGAAPLYNHLLVGLELDRSVLFERINRRVDLMVEAGWIEEVRSLVDAGFGESQSMKAIGYREIEAYLGGGVDLEQALELIKRNTRRYAKRQFTYFRNKLDVHWLDALEGTRQNTQKILGFMKDFGPPERNT